MKTYIMHVMAFTLIVILALQVGALNDEIEGLKQELTQLDKLVEANEKADDALGYKTAMIGRYCMEQNIGMSTCLIKLIETLPYNSHRYTMASVLNNNIKLTKECRDSILAVEHKYNNYD